jgi:HK97 gp10 family phage protein
MSKPLKVQVNDTYFNKALNKLKALENDFANEVDLELNAAAVDIERIAKENVTTVKYGRMRSAIKANKLSLLRYEVRVSTNYAAYVEFGTGKEYKKYEPKLTNEWRNIAADFWVNGEGTTRPAPYLYPAAKKVLKDFKNRFKDRLKALLKK